MSNKRKPKYGDEIFMTAPAISGKRKRAQVLVRACRNHFHVYLADDECDDLAGPGDPFPTRDEAQRVADALNRDEPWPAPEGGR